MTEKFVSDVIDYERDIEPYQMITIYSGVGSGKNTWLNNLDKKGKSILLITSRKATAQAQAEKMGAKRWIDLEYLSKETLGTKSQNKVVVTNAGIEWFLRNTFDLENEETHIWKYFDLIVLDEAHSLTTDATFTDPSFHVKEFLRWVQTHDPRCKLIFMTGTPEPIEWMFSKKTKQSKNFNFLNLYNRCRHVTPKDVYLYPASGIEKDIAFEIEKGARIIYFVNSITRMEKIVPLLIANGVDEEKIGIAYSGEEKRKFSENLLRKKDEIQEYLLEKESLPPEIKIFLTTSKNQEGINIEGTDIRFMICESCERAALVQMAGRVRKGLDILVILYDAKQHENAAEYFELVLDEYCLQSINEFWEDYSDCYFENGIQKVIEAIEKKFPAIRYSYFKKSFCYYKAREYGVDYKIDDKKFLDTCIKNWNELPDDIDLNNLALNDIDTETRKGQGQLDFEKWFPYSECSLWRETTSHVIAEKSQLREKIIEFLESGSYWGKSLTAAEKASFAEELNLRLDEWGYDYTGMNITYPVKQLNRFLNRFEYELIEEAGKRKGTSYVLRKTTEE